MTLSSTTNKKTFYFEIIKYILDENQLLEAAQKVGIRCHSQKSLENEMPTKRKIIILKVFGTGSQYLYSKLFHNGNFLLQLLPTA